MDANEMQRRANEARNFIRDLSLVAQRTRGECDAATARAEVAAVSEPVKHLFPLVDRVGAFALMREAQVPPGQRSALWRRICTEVLGHVPDWSTEHLLTSHRWEQIESALEAALAAAQEGEAP